MNVALKKFEKFGYAKIQNLIPKKIVNEINDSIYLNARKYCQISGIKIDKSDNLNKILVKLRKKNKKNFGLLFDSLQTLGKAYEALNSKKILNKISFFLKVKSNLLTFTDAAIRLDAPNDKRNSLGWHQDSSYCRQNRNGTNGIVLWSPLVEVRKCMGRLQFIEQSHSAGSLHIPKKKNKKFKTQQREVPRKIIDEFKKISEIDLSVGDALLLNLDIFHRSGINKSQEFRISLLGRYHNMVSHDFKSGLNVYNYSDKEYNKQAYEIT